MGKNINTGVWTLDASGYTQTVADLFTGETPVYTHADHIDNSFNYCVNGVGIQSKRALFHLTDRANNVYSLENTDCIFIPDCIYDNRGNIGLYAIGSVLGTNGGVSNFAIDPESYNQPAADFKIRPNFTYLTTIWSPRINVQEYDSVNHIAGNNNYMSLNDLDAESTAEDAQEGESWWDYYKRKESNYILSMDLLYGQTYEKKGAFQSTSVFEGQTQVGIPIIRVSWLMAPHSYNNNSGTANCYIYNTNGREQYDDYTFNILFSMSTDVLVKKDEWEDVDYSKPRHNILYGVKIDKDTILKIICSYALPFSFKNAINITIGDADYALPEIKNNTTTGNYFRGADAITADTDNNRWANTKDIDNKSPGGGGGGGGGYDDDPWNGATFAGTGVGGAGAFAKCYYMTSTELANLRSWMNSINVPEGFDPMQQIIGLSQVPVALSGSGSENVVFVNSSAVYDPGVTTRAVDTGVATQQAMGTPISYYLGSVDIVRRMQQRGEPYLDYDCQIELYLPLIGMFSLDTQAVMGRTISAYAVLDPVSGTLAAYAYVTKDGQNLPVAYGSTTIGVDLPISAQQLSVSRAALKQANAQLGASLLSGALTMLAAASSSGKSSGSGAKTSTGSSGLSAAGIREAGSDYMKASQVGNVFGDFMNWGRTIRQLSYGNNTAIAGSFGGSTAQWAYPFTPYVKIIRPRYEKPSNYNHSQGVPCVQTKTIGSCTGFIQCIGADVSGITGATDLELQAIQAALSNGIYAGGGQ